MAKKRIEEPEITIKQRLDRVMELNHKIAEANGNIAESQRAMYAYWSEQRNHLQQIEIESLREQQERMQQ
jgi:hypothetical protein